MFEESVLQQDEIDCKTQPATEDVVYLQMSCGSIVGLRKIVWSPVNFNKRSGRAYKKALPKACHERDLGFRSTFFFGLGRILSNGFGSTSLFRHFNDFLLGTTSIRKKSSLFGNFRTAACLAANRSVGGIVITNGQKDIIPIGNQVLVFGHFTKRVKLYGPKGSLESYQSKWVHRPTGGQS